MVVNSKIMIFWDVASCNLIDRYECFGGTCFLLFGIGESVFYFCNEVETLNYSCVLLNSGPKNERI
jgi:hypothetical protein